LFKENAFWEGDMPTISSQVIVRQKSDDLYRLLKSLDHYPTFLTHIESLKVLSASNNTALAEWCINVSGTRLRWKQLDIYDDAHASIRFRMLEGDYGHYEGEWELQPKGEVTRLSLKANIEWGLPHLSRYIDPFLQRKAELTIRSMLLAIKRRAEMGDGFRPYIPTVSELVEFPNRDGKRIVGFLDHLQSRFETLPFIVMPPGYGETKRDALTAAYWLVRNGFNVLRYDATDHVGESEGDITNTTMTKLKVNLLSAIDFLQRKFQIERVGVIASSLAQRVALKAAAEDRRIVFLLGVVGVVNLQETLKAIYQEDMIASCLAGKRWGVTEVLGFDVSGRFLETAIAERYHDLKTAQEDMLRLNIPVVFLVAEKDAWVKLDDVKVVLESTRQGEMHIIPDAMHQIFENPRSAKIALRQMVVSATRHLAGRRLNLLEVLEPNVRELATQNQLERERLRRLTQITSEGERQFWQEYLGSYQMLAKVPDYQQYMEMLQRLLGLPRKGQVVLDAGCGVGYYGAWLLSHLPAAIRNIHPKDRVHSLGGLYIGLDFVESALRQAMIKHREIVDSLRQELGTKEGVLEKTLFRLHYIQADLNVRIPLADGSVDKICCSLVLPYVQDPLATLHDLVRILKPGGRIVVSSLKPYADLSEIYRNFVSQAQNEQDLIEARRLLSNAGRIKQKEGEGHYHFFSERELIALMIAVGLERVKVYRSFGNQVNVAVAAKRAPARRTKR